MRLLVVCPNLAADRTLRIGPLQRGEAQRAGSAIVQAGGKGVNAARVARALGADPVVVGFAGGATGRQIADDLERSGLAARLVPLEAESRSTVALVEPDGTVTLVNEPGPQVDDDDVERLLQAAESAAAGVTLVLVTGSLPPGAPVDLYARVVRRLRAQSVAVDAAGDALAAAIAAGPVLVAPNAEEAAPFGATPVEAARALVAGGAEAAVVTLGAAGAVLADAAGVRRYASATVRAVNATGSGDALAAGTLVALGRGRPLADALRLGLAAAADNATREPAGWVDAAAVARLEASLPEAVDA